MKKQVGLFVLMISLLAGFAGSSQKVSAQPFYWQEHYMNEYKVRVVKPTRIQSVVGTGSMNYRYHNAGYLHRGEVVRTWYAGVAGFDWHLTGGAHGKYDGNHTHQFNVNWKSRKSFKILKVYHGYHWF